ncbi:putative proton-dependent oligopeptide transporter family [Helianthus annuus]|uniref:Proton-dependent oligopeptide transporter family n=1 Tax=Helianthus annuus TaxID=4232 RepID=A0A9K3HVD3_HELAN|nr:putative proton-dependent oligopeptide transporter family [Helianthus annuus]KAJ0512969.1 putative MFS transporter superfamily [Helianthus annuus]KAJ0529089.1 putative MFS transporter superfamily [Helianthus annuus]
MYPIKNSYYFEHVEIIQYEFILSILILDELGLIRPLFTSLSLQGLMLLWLFNPYDVKWLVVISLVLLSIGTSGANILQDVLKDLVNDIDKSQDQNKARSLARAAIWSRIAYLSGVMSAILWVATDAVGGVHPSWRSTFLICLITMTTTSIIFCAGHNIYHQGELTKRPAEVFFRVFCARVKKLLKCNLR